MSFLSPSDVEWMKLISDAIKPSNVYIYIYMQTTHWLSYTNSPRAKIFRRDHPKVTSMADMAAIMRSNDWRNDPVRILTQRCYFAHSLLDAVYYVFSCGFLCRFREEYGI
jgi:hypothetical protein